MKRSDDYQTLFQQALKAGQNRDYPRAIDLLSRITSETDAIPQAFLYLGRSFHAIGRFDLAIQPLRYFIQVSPDSGAGYFFLGRALLALELPAHAVRNFKRVLEIEPDSVQALGLIGMAYLKAKRPELASQYLARAVVLDPENTNLYTAYLNSLLVQAIRVFHRGDLDLARQMFEFILGKGHDGILLHLYLAIIYREHGEAAMALDHYDRALKISPNDPVILFQRAVLLHQSGDVRGAEEELRRLNLVPDAKQFGWDGGDKVAAVQHFQKGQHVKAIFFAEKVLHVEPKDVDMHLLIGEAYRALGEMEEARNHFKRVIDVNRKALEPHFGLAMISWQTEKWSELETELAAIERIDPGNTMGKYYSALCACKLMRPTEETIPALQQQIRDTGPDAYLFSALGGEYVRSGLSDLAEKWFVKALTLDENQYAAYLGLIDVYRELSDGEKTIDAYRRYLSKTQDLRVHRDFIQFLVEAEDFENAAAEIQRYLPMRKGDSRLQRLLALCYRKTSRFREASIIYRQLLREEPKNEDNLRSLVYCMENLGNHTAAIELMERALKYIGSSANLCLITGVLLYKSGNMERALVHFRKVVQTAKKDWRGYYNMAMVYKKQGVETFAKKYFAQAEAIRTNITKKQKTPQ